MGGKKGFLGIVAHYVTATGELRDLPIALPQLTGSHSGERMGEIVLATLRSFSTSANKVGYFVLNNAINNNTVGRGVSRTGRYCLPQVLLHVCSHALPL
jgi:hypothetical protein